MYKYKYVYIYMYTYLFIQVHSETYVMLFYGSCGFNFATIIPDIFQIQRVVPYGK